MVAVWNEAQKAEALELHRVPEACRGGHRRPGVRPLVRPPAVEDPRRVLPRGRPAARPAVRAVHRLVDLHRPRGSGDAVRAPVDRGAARLQRIRSSAISRCWCARTPTTGRPGAPEDFDGLDGVAVWPRGGYDPIDEANRVGLFDSLHYCEAVVGINTSAMIEAAIVGRPVLAIETPEFAGSQDGTLHYQHLLPENGGFLRVASSFDAHVEQLSGVLRDPGATRAGDRALRRQLHPPARSRHRRRRRSWSRRSSASARRRRRGRRRLPGRRALLRVLLRPAAALAGPLFPSPSGRRRAGRAGPSEDAERHAPREDHRCAGAASIR